MRRNWPTPLRCLWWCVRASLAIQVKFADAHPTSTNWRSDLGKTYARIGQLFWAEGKFNEAAANYLEAFEIRKVLIAADPLNMEWQADLLVSYEDMGAVLQKEGRLDGSLRYYQNGRAIAAQLVLADPENVYWRFLSMATEVFLG